MKSEPTQKGNPHDLTRLQHTFPSRSIKRFCNDRGGVDIYMLRHKIRRFAKPDDEIFCARRRWDERAEKGYGKHIEDEFQKVVDRVLGEKNLVAPSENLAITEFYALWNIRYQWSKVFVNDEPIKGIKEIEAVRLTPDEKEHLEKNHIIYPTDELSFPARQMCGIRMQMDIDRVVENMVGVEWGILLASEKEFIVPDNFLERRIVPITPNACLVAEHDSGVLSGQDVDCINSLAINSAKDYIFARDLESIASKLPTLKAK